MFRPDRQRAALFISLLAFLFVAPSQAARQRIVPRPATPVVEAPRDIFSFAEPAKVTTRHLSLDLDVDFESRTLHGSATLTIDNHSGTERLLLDSRNLTIESVTLDGSTPAEFSVGTRSHVGAPLSIAIRPTTRTVTIRYRTANNASGLYWNTAAQSYGRQQPFLFSQNESYHARSWMPVQDSPQIRMTYDATLRVPRGLLALMSAENPRATNDSGVYTFRMPEPIPAYLIAIAVARLEFRELSPRTGVYAEPELIDDAAYELSYLPAMLEAGERVAGPYPFARHDVLMMPPTYPLGGMEHPRLNFLNPFSSIITLNRPAQPLPASLVAHELAHAWAGDSATLATWSDVWLNEGITQYITLRIIEELSGPRRAEYNWFNDRRSFADLVSRGPNSLGTVMHRNLTTADNPDTLFNSAAYTKGELFLRTIEDHVGRETLDRFLRDYFAAFRYRWVDDRAFLSLLRERVIQGNAELESRLRLDEWIYRPGLPSNVTAPTSSALYNDVAAQAAAFESGRPASQLNRANWTNIELELFLNLAATTVGARMAEVDAAFQLSSRTTPPTVWLVIAARTNYTPAFAAIERVLLRGGPNQAVINIYDALASTNEGRGLARSVFERARNRYEDTVMRTVERRLNSTNTLDLTWTLRLLMPHPHEEHAHTHAH